MAFGTSPSLTLSLSLCLFISFNLVNFYRKTLWQTQYNDICTTVLFCLPPDANVHLSPWIVCIVVISIISCRGWGYKQKIYLLVYGQNLNTSK